MRPHLYIAAALAVPPTNNQPTETPKIVMNDTAFTSGPLALNWSLPEFLKQGMPFGHGNNSTSWHRVSYRKAARQARARRRSFRTH